MATGKARSQPPVAVSQSPEKKQKEQKDGLHNADSHDHLLRESFSICEYLNVKKDELKTRYGTEQSKKKRPTQYYFINNHQSILVIMQGDITKTKVDAIVNAANEHMTGGGGVDGIIHDAAGPDLYHACKAHKKIEYGVRLPTGHSRILLSYDMVATTSYIINTSGPIFSHSQAKACKQELTSCYKTSLALAKLYDLESIGYTAISCGIFGYPIDEAAEVALQTVDQEADSLPVVVFVLWDDHIYDTWRKTAEALKFPKFSIDDPPKISPKTSQKKQSHNDSSRTIVGDDKEEQPASMSNRDSSTQDHASDRSEGHQSTSASTAHSTTGDNSSDSQLTGAVAPSTSSTTDRDSISSSQQTQEIVNVSGEQSISNDASNNSMITTRNKDINHVPSITESRDANQEKVQGDTDDSSDRGNRKD